MSHESRSRSIAFFKVLKDLVENGPSNYKEVTKRTGLTDSQVSSHMSTMVAKGFIEDLTDEDGEYVRRDKCRVRGIVSGVELPELPKVMLDDNSEECQRLREAIRLMYDMLVQIADEYNIPLTD